VPHHRHDRLVRGDLGGRRLATLRTALPVLCHQLDVKAHDLAPIVDGDLDTTLRVDAQRCVGATQHQRAGEA